MEKPTFSALSINNYAEISFSNDSRRLWNPVLKKSYADRPEERVRLAWVDTLLEKEMWPSSRIGFEQPVDSKIKQAHLRSDLILYNADFKPEVLLECKAPGIPVDAAVLQQAIIYNETVNAAYIILTNGENDICFDVKNRVFRSVSEILVSKKNIERTPEFWQKRGFLGRIETEKMDTSAQLFMPYWNALPRPAFAQLFRNPISGSEIIHYIKHEKPDVAWTLFSETGKETVLAAFFSVDKEMVAVGIDMTNGIQGEQEIIIRKAGADKVSVIFKWQKRVSIHDVSTFLKAIETLVRQ